MFNLLTVMIMLPLEIATGVLQRIAEFLVQPLQSLGAGGEFHSPIKAAVKFPAKAVKHFLEEGCGLESWGLAAPMFFIALAAIIIALIVVTKNMRSLMADQIEEWINRVLKKSGLLGILIGAVMTALVQSSSITTSLMVPMFGAGILTLEAAFPVMLGANLGTTVTALLAAMVGSPAGLAIALVHFLFNLAGTAIYFPFKKVRQIPIKMAEFVANKSTENRIWVFVYIGLVFVVIPVLGILIWRQPPAPPA
jgi:sodium-dependent phosphate cotransporter